MSEETTTSPKLSIIEKKAELLELARAGGKRPSQKTSLGSDLSNYVNPKNGSYDAELVATLKDYSPSWFRTPKIKKED